MRRQVDIVICIGCPGVGPVQWLVLHAVESFTGITMPPELSYDVTASLCAQLEAIGQWRLAVFVASRLRCMSPDATHDFSTLHTPAFGDDEAAGVLTHDVLYRHAAEIVDTVTEV